MDYFHTISALYHKLLDYFTNVIGMKSKYKNRQTDNAKKLLDLEKMLEKK